jgi:hypothetical protein
MARAEERSRPQCAVCGESVQRAEQLTVFFCRFCLGVLGPSFLALPAGSVSFGAQVQEGLSVPLPQAAAQALGIGPCDEVRWVLSAQGLMLQVSRKAGEASEADDGESVV